MTLDENGKPLTIEPYEVFIVQESEPDSYSRSFLRTYFYDHYIKDGTPRIYDSLSVLEMYKKWLEKNGNKVTVIKEIK